MPYTELNRESRGRLLAALNDVARVVFPGLIAPIEVVAEAASLAGRIRLTLDDLPSDVIEDVRTNREFYSTQISSWQGGVSEREIARKALSKYILGHNRNPLRFRKPMDEILWPTVKSICHNIDPKSLRLIWEQMLKSRIQHQLISDTVLNLAEVFCESPWSPNTQRARYAELSLFENVWSWESLFSPSLAFAVTQTINLSFETGIYQKDKVLGWALRLGRISLAKRALSSEDTEESESGRLEQRIDRLCRLSAKMEGLLYLLGEHLSDYTSSLEQVERQWYSQNGSLPSLADLKQLLDKQLHTADGQIDSDSASCESYLLRDSAEKYFTFHEGIYNAVPHLISSLFYVDREVYQLERTQRIVEQAERWLCYWFANGHRYGVRQTSISHDRFAAEQVRLEVVRTWHEERIPARLLAKARRILQNQDCQRWAEFVTEGETYATSEFLLPCWLLEIRALRMHGRGSPEWNEANQLATSRLPRLIHGYSITQLWSSDPGLLLFFLEAVRQIAVSYAGTDQAEDVAVAILNGARELYLRLEMVDCSSTRRILLGYLHPILTAIAGWRTRTHSEPAEGLCLFQMARSRWMIDQLSLGNRTLVASPRDDDSSRNLKEQLFYELNPGAHLHSDGVLNVPSSELIRELRERAPDLGRLVLSNWLKPDVLKSIPENAAALVFEIDHDPADPPSLQIGKSSEPWSSLSPGNDSELWIFLVCNGQVHAQLADRSCCDILCESRTLKSLFAQGLVAHEQPAYAWSQREIVRYETQLERLAEFLLHPFAAAIQDSLITHLLLVPSGELFEIPWAAMPVMSSPTSSRLMDVAAIGVLPNLGLAIWQSEGQASNAAKMSKREILVQSSPDPPSGLRIDKNLLNTLRILGAGISEGSRATPARALEVLQNSDFVAILCHGRLDSGLYLELSPPGKEGRLTAKQLESMPALQAEPTVLLGACWTGLKVQQAAEGAEGLAGLLLLKGVRSVLAGNGCIPIPVELITNLTGAVFSQSPSSAAKQNLAELLQQVQKRMRDSHHASHGIRMHPWRWSAIAFHGVPWS